MVRVIIVGSLDHLGLIDVITILVIVVLVRCVSHVMVVVVVELLLVVGLVVGLVVIPLVVGLPVLLHHASPHISHEVLVLVGLTRDLVLVLVHSLAYHFSIIVGQLSYLFLILVDCLPNEDSRLEGHLLGFLRVFVVEGRSCVE